MSPWYYSFFHQQHHSWICCILNQSIFCAIYEWLDTYSMYILASMYVYILLTVQGWLHSGAATFSSQRWAPQAILLVIIASVLFKKKHNYRIEVRQAFYLKNSDEDIIHWWNLAVFLGSSRNLRCELQVCCHLRTC
jgi:hypothetical protein